MSYQFDGEIPYAIQFARAQVEHNKEAVLAAHQRSPFHRTPLVPVPEEQARQETGKYYLSVLKEMQEQADICQVETVLMPAIPKQATDEMTPLTPRITVPLLVHFYQDATGKWHYEDREQVYVDCLLSKAIDAYVQETNTIPEQALTISSFNYLLLHLSGRLSEARCYEDERGVFLVRDVALMDDATVIFG